MRQIYQDEYMIFIKEITKTLIHTHIIIYI
jgi:hypothetical protein